MSVILQLGFSQGAVERDEDRPRGTYHSCVWVFSTGEIEEAQRESVLLRSVFHCSDSVGLFTDSWHTLTSCFWFRARKTFSNQLLDWFIKLGVCFLPVQLASVMLEYCVGGCYADAWMECSSLLLGCSSGCSMLFWRILGCLYIFIYIYIILFILLLGCLGGC